MKKLVAVLFLFGGFVAQAQKVVKPAGNQKEHFSLTINKQPYKTYISNFIAKPIYKKMWLDLLKKQPEEQWKDLKGKKLTATISLMIDVDETGMVKVSNYESSCSNAIGEELLKDVVKTIGDDLMKEIKKSGVVTPSYNKILRNYVGNTEEVKQDWKVML
jgi:hypothetical protein